MLSEIVRCPYCVQGGCFRPMLLRPTGWYLCLGCGHSTVPNDPYARCACERCQAMNQAADRCRNIHESRRYASDTALPAAH